MQNLTKSPRISTFAKKFFYLLNWFNREKITLCIASLALALGAIFPWYSLPPEALKTFTTDLSLANTGRYVAAFFAVSGFVYTFLFGLTRIPRLPVWGGLIGVLIFPYLLTVLSPTVTFLAASYYEQGLRSTQHVERNFTQVQAQWKQNILLPESIPVTSVVNFSITDTRFFQMPSWDEVVTKGLAYSNQFFGFIGRGWVFTVIGLVIGLAALYLGLADENLNLFLKDMGKVVPGVGLLFAVLIFFQILPNIINYQLDTMFVKGEYHQVISSSQSLASWYPLLNGDAEFLQRMAKARFYGNEPEDPALTYFAKGIERYRLGDLLKAEDYFQRSLDIQPRHFLVRGYLATTILNEGVNYLNDSNSRKPETAAERCEQVLRIFPNHVESLYDLMLARAVNGEFEKSAVAAQQIIKTLKYFQKPSYALLGQAYLHSAWASYHNGDLTESWKQYRQSIDSTVWKESKEAK